MSTQTPKRHKRSQYVVDRKLQLTFAAQLLGILAGVAALYVAGLFYLPGRPDFSKLTGEEVRSLLLRATALYFVMGAVILGLAFVVLMNRVAGPAYSIRRSLDAFKRGDFSRPVVLRRRDHMKALARSVEDLRLQILAERDERARVLSDLVRCLDENDAAGAREIAARLQGDATARTEAEPVEV